MLIASQLGTRLAVYTFLLYILEAFVGFPITTIKAVGMGLFMAPSFGYIIGYIFMAYIIGLMKDNGHDRKILTSIPYILLGNQIMFVFGVVFLAYVLGSFEKAFLYGYLPFILFDLIKVSIVVLSLSVIARFRNSI
jgi:biotin transport system substrate-specific component